MQWINFEGFAIASLLCWLAASVWIALMPANTTAQKGAISLASAGTVILLTFIVLLWLRIERPPMRTLGETRLWYSFMLPAIGIISFSRWKYNWLLLYSLFMGALFLIINIMKPETHDKSLMPALQSFWFVPHVIVYMFAYALLAASSLAGLKALYLDYKGKSWNEIPNLADNFVFLGFAFLTMGLLFGALWAKEAWGHYWTWDPKETWAFITWTAYLIYIHYRYRHQSKHKEAMLILVVSFALLLVCWFGVNYLPTAQNSVHTYSGS